MRRFGNVIIYSKNSFGEHFQKQAFLYKASFFGVIDHLHVGVSSGEWGLEHELERNMVVPRLTG